MGAPSKEETTVAVEEGPAEVSKPGAEVGTVAAGAGVHSPAVPAAADGIKAHPGRRWAVLFASCMGVLLASIQTSALIIAFPTLITQLQTPMFTMLWVLLCVLLVISAVTPVAGKLGDVFGQATLFNVGFIVFWLSSLLAGFSNSGNHGTDLLGYRVIMGFGAAFLFTNSSAIITDAFAPFGQVGLAQGLFQLAASAGTVLGPVIGGSLAVHDWRWIFWMNTPIAGFCCVLSLWSIRDTKPRTKTLRDFALTFDWLGTLLILGFLVLSILAMTQAVAADPVLSTTASIASLIVVSAACLVGFIVNEKYAKDPIIPLDLFSGKVFSLSTVAGAAMSFARGSVTYNMIFFLQGPYGQDAMQAGLQLIPFGIGVMSSGFFAGLLADKMGPRLLAAVGPVVSIAGTVGLLELQKDTNYWLIAFALFVVGFGTGIFNAPNGLAGMMSVKPQERGIASAVRMVAMMFPQMVGIVITFSYVLNSMSYNELLVLFIYGGADLSDSAVHDCLAALRKDYYIVIAMFIICTLTSAAIPASFNMNQARAMMTNAAAPRADPSSGSDTQEVKVASHGDKDTPDGIELGSLPAKAADDAAAVGSPYSEQTQNALEVFTPQVVEPSAAAPGPGPVSNDSASVTVNSNKAEVV